MTKGRIEEMLGTSGEQVTSTPTGFTAIDEPETRQVSLSEAFNDLASELLEMAKAVGAAIPERRTNGEDDGSVETKVRRMVLSVRYLTTVTGAIRERVDFLQGRLESIKELL